MLTAEGVSGWQVIVSGSRRGRLGVGGAKSRSLPLRRIVAPPFLTTAPRARCNPYPLLFLDALVASCILSAVSDGLQSFAPYCPYAHEANMRFTLVSALALPVLAAAHSPAGVRHHVRDGTSTSTASASSGSSSASSAAASSASSAASSASSAASSASSHSGSASVAQSSNMGTITFTLASTNPTAVPYQSLTYGEPTQSTHAMATTYTAGSQPSDIPQAPPIPNCMCAFITSVLLTEDWHRGVVEPEELPDA